MTSPAKTPEPGAQFLGEFQSFLKFLQNLWSTLAGISVFFPLSNVLAQVIPLQPIDKDGAFAQLPTAVITTLTTLATLFVILWTFSHRNQFRDASARPRVQRTSMLSFGAGALALVLYIVGYKFKLSYAYDVWHWESQDPRHLLAEVPLMLVYAAGFALVTRAFVLLGMLEFFSDSDRAGT